MSDSVLAVRSGLARALGLLVSLGVAFFMTPLIVDALGHRWYGLWSVVGTIIGYYGYLDFGLSTAVQHYLARALGKKDVHEVKTLITTAVFVFAILGTIAFLASCLTAALGGWFFLDPVELSRFRIVVLLMGSGFLVDFPMMAFNGLFSGNVRYDIVTCIQTAKVLFRALLILAALRSEFTIVVLAVVVLVSNLAFHVVTLLTAMRVFGGLFLDIKSVSLSNIPKLVSYGARGTVAQVGNILRYQLDVLVVTSFVSLSAVTFYTIGSQLVRYFMQLVSMMINVMMPIYAKRYENNDWTGIRRIFSLSIKISTAISFLLASFAVILGKQFLVLWMGEDFSVSYVVMVILLLSCSLNVSLQPVINLVYGMNRHGLYAKISVAEGVANLIFSLVFVRLWGLYGVALGTTVSMTVASFVLLARVLPMCGLSIGSYWSSVRISLCIAFVCAVVGCFVMVNVDISSWLRLVAWGGFLFFVQSLIFWFATFDVGERKLLVGALSRALGFSRMVT